MDLLDFTPKNDTLEIILMYGEQTVCNEDGSEMSVTVYLPHSKEAKAVQHEFTNRQLKKMSKKNKATDITSEELEELSLERLAKVTKTWDITYNKKKPKFDVETAMEVYSKAPWIRSLIEDEVEKTLDFTKV